MRRWAIALALAAALVFPLAGLADDSAGDEEGAEASGEAATGDEAAKSTQEAEPAPEAAAEEEAGEEEASAWDEYAASVVERFLTGLNGLVTALADPPMATVEPPKALEKAGYVRRPLGFASGILLMGYRTFTGAVDFGLALVPKLPVLSPVPRYKLIPGFEHEDE